MLFGSIEAGGTKFVCAVGDERRQVVARVVFPTTTPQETLSTTVDFFKRFDDLAALSVASFGPIEMRPTADKYGYITTTPKPNWSDTDVLGYLKKNLTVPMYWTTDVNGSAFGEYITYQQHHDEVTSLVYFTVGTGIGAGAIENGRFIGHAGNPEMGHTHVKRHPDDLDFEGVCPYHGDCLEGVASGPTFEARLGIPGAKVPLTNHVWDIIAFYIAQAAEQATMVLRPDKVIFGGGVMNPTLLTKVRHEFTELVNGYIDLGDLDQYIVMPLVEENGSATIGNFALAQRVFEQKN
ncbi:fructokinase ScrK [Furfurilactobacillus curtus]|uniref:fructokinase n=1 Tax=Furfurilactobacillus curtus TaxID=1746200 RepID=A0ABQ5JTW0_9LACO